MCMRLMHMITSQHSQALQDVIPHAFGIYYSVQQSSILLCIINKKMSTNRKKGRLLYACRRVILCSVVYSYKKYNHVIFFFGQ